MNQARDFLMTKIGLIGCGMWGRNLARNLAGLDALHAVADSSRERAETFAGAFGGTVMDVDSLIGETGLDGVVVAASAPAHRDLVCAALAGGHHVFVEKPLALNMDDAMAMAGVARSAGRQLMTGHLLRYHPAFETLCRMVADGAIGALRHMVANRLAMGRVRSTESVLHDLCPHDISMVLALAGEEPRRITCGGAGHITPGIEDHVVATLAFESGATAVLNCAWNSPVKEHRLVVTGDAGSIVFDDTRGWDQKLTLYRDNIERDGDAFHITRQPPETIELPEAEPLAREMAAFIECARTGKAPPTCIDEALAVQRVLEGMQRQLDTGTPGKAEKHTGARNATARGVKAPNAPSRNTRTTSASPRGVGDAALVAGGGAGA